MASPHLSGALEGLRVLSLADLEGYKAAVAAGGQVGWGYYFPYLLALTRSNRKKVLLCEDEGSICVFFWRLRREAPHLDLHVPPVPMNVGVLGRCLERANEFNGDRSARILRIDAQDAAAASSLPKLRVKQRKMQYLYGPNTYEDLSGSKFYTIRRNVSMIQRLPSVEVVPYSEAYSQDCRELLQRWLKRHRDEHGTSGGAGTSSRAIDLAGDLSETDITGEVVLLDGRVAAFAFGGEIRPGVGCIFETKTDHGVRGLAYFQRFRLLAKLRAFERVNDGSDVGRAGLRQMKDSFRPVEMHAEYRGWQSGA